MNKHPVSWWCCQANFLHGISCYFEANLKIILLCYFFLKLFVCAILYAFFNYGLKATNIQTTIWFELFTFFLSRLKSLPFPFLKFADLPILRPFVREKCLSCWTPFQNPLPCQFSLRKKITLPWKKFFYSRLSSTFQKKHTVSQKNLLLFSFYIFCFPTEYLKCSRESFSIVICLFVFSFWKLFCFCHPFWTFWWFEPLRQVPLWKTFLARWII